MACLCLGNAKTRDVSVHPDNDRWEHEYTNAQLLSNKATAVRVMTHLFIGQVY